MPEMTLLRGVGIGLVLIVATGCRPRSRNMLVAYVQGEVLLPALTSAIWNVDETKECEIATRDDLSNPPSDERGDLLLCGDKTRFAWSQTWLRGDIKSQIYQSAKEQAVKFHSIGHSGPHKGSPSWWRCRRTLDGIDCRW